MWVSEGRAKTMRCCGPNMLAQTIIAILQWVTDACVASQCMAWRFRDHPDGEPQGTCGLAGDVRNDKYRSAWIDPKDDPGFPRE